jgi:hypothetical protein
MQKCFCHGIETCAVQQQPRVNPFPRFSQQKLDGTIYLRCCFFVLTYADHEMRACDGGFIQWFGEVSPLRRKIGEALVND